jgi:hypothetical protein
MSETIVNLALPIVSEKVEQMLQDMPLSSQTAPSTAELKQRLVAYVLSRIPGFYITSEQAVVCSVANPSSCYSSEQHRQIEQLIYQGLRQMSGQRCDWATHNLSSLSAVNNVSSVWFG